MRFLPLLFAVEENGRYDAGLLVPYWSARFRDNMIWRSFKQFLVLPSQDARLLFAGIYIDACRMRDLPAISLQAVQSG